MSELTANQKAFSRYLAKELESANNDLFLAISMMSKHCTKTNIRLRNINKRLTTQQRNEVIQWVMNQ